MALSVAGSGDGGWGGSRPEEIRTNGTSMFIGLIGVRRWGGSITWVVTRRGNRIGRRAPIAYT